MKIAVTGATGFIGRHVVTELERRSISPILMCRPSTRQPWNDRRHTVAPIDVHDLPSNLYDVMGRPDTLIHLAWGGLPHFSSMHHIESELPAQYLFLKRLVEAGLSNLFVSGTCLEYGMQSGPLKEDLDTKPATAYGLAKDMLRRQLEYLKQTQGFNLTWARLFYVFGEGQPENSLRPQVRRAVDKGDECFNMSGGEQLRDYLPVDEVARYIVSLSLAAEDRGIVNVCSGKPISVRKLVETWVVENSWPIRLNFGYHPYPSYEPMAFWGEREKLNRCLGLQ